jgi:prevent-host-death family protein
METVGAFEAKTHLASLLQRVARGESFTITRHGAPVAQLVPVQKRDPERIKAAIQRIQEIAAGQTLDGDWREFRDAGRKW